MSTPRKGFEPCIRSGRADGVGAGLREEEVESWGNELDENTDDEGDEAPVVGMTLPVLGAGVLTGLVMMWEEAGLLGGMPAIITPR